jgi:predicted dehydrogenase
MYLDALATHPDAQVVAVCGRDYQRAHDFAEQHGVASYHTDYRDLLDSDIDAVIVSTPHNMHYPITMHALKNGLHVFCEKPLALTYAQADAMATEAERRDLINMTGFTYTFFPHYRYITQLVREGYIGQPFHLNMRFYSMTALDGNPMWRMDRRRGGEGALADIGVHLISVARIVLGDVTSVRTILSTHVERDGIPAEHRASDNAILTLTFANGAVGVLQSSMVAAHPRQGAQRQAMELSGSEGVVYFENDFTTTFSLRGAKVGETLAEPLEIPDRLLPESIRSDSPRVMFEDLFSKADTMAREFVSAIAEARPINGPDFREGAEVQKIVDAAIASHHQGGAAVHLT